MMGQKLHETMNSQIQAEMYSANLYLAMSHYAQSKNFKGFASWLHVQFQEEQTHALKLMGYLAQRGVTVEIRAIEAPPTDFGSPIEMFEKVLEHEQHVTALIHGLYGVAIEEKDYAAQMFLQWFVTEQVEEEASVTDVIDKLKMSGKNEGAIFYIDQELAQRVFVDATATV